MNFAWRMEIKDKNDKLLAEIKEPITARFDIKRDTTRMPNSAGISVYNLKESTRMALQKYAPINAYSFDLAFNMGEITNYGLDDYRSIVFSISRDGRESVAFAGTITSCHSTRQGGEWVTQFECGDGFFASRFAVTDITIEPDFAATVQIEREAKRWKLGVDISGRPHTSSKPASFESLVKMLDFSFPNNWFIDSETLRAFGEGANFGKKIFVLGGNQITGSPKRTKYTLQIETIFMPELRLGQVVEVRSTVTKDYNAQWELASISHSGELGIGSSGECKTSVLCIPPGMRFENL